MDTNRKQACAALSAPRHVVSFLKKVSMLLKVFAFWQSFRNRSPLNGLPYQPQKPREPKQRGKKYTRLAFLFVFRIGVMAYELRWDNGDFANGRKKDSGLYLCLMSVLIDWPLIESCMSFSGIVKEANLLYYFVISRAFCCFHMEQALSACSAHLAKH